MQENKIKELLKKRSLKATNIRISLISKIDNFGSAISYSSILKEMTPINRVTLYRTIKTLKEKGIIHTAFKDKNETYYALCGTECDSQDHHEHVHFKCLECETITPQELSENVKISIPKYDISKITVNIEGICESCI